MTTKSCNANSTQAPAPSEKLAAALPLAAFIALPLGMLLFVTPVSAQIFPRIEKEEVQRRIQSGKDDTADAVETPDKPVAPTKTVDGEKALRRFQELLAGYAKDEKAIWEASERHTSTLHVSVRDYIEASILLRMGRYKDADKRFKAIGSSVKKEDEAPSRECKNLINEIKAGRGYYLRMIAVVMDYWKEFDTEEQVLAAWDKAYRDGEKIVQEARKAIDKKKIENGENLPGQMTSWLLNGRLYWINLWTAQQNVKKLPANVNSWKQLISATGGREGKSEEYTPMYLTQRAALEVAREFFQHDEFVMGGTADKALGWNHLALGHLDGWPAFFEPKPYHTPGGRIALAAGKIIAEGWMKIMDALKAS
ncbi:MAG: hypothetical protein IT464_05715 [Planctomycetes bacterium]|nr:hypothetical protein [Planctomycetota bacterium]